MKQGKGLFAADVMSTVEVEIDRAEITENKLRCVVVQVYFPIYVNLLWLVKVQMLILLGSGWRSSTQRQNQTRGTRSRQQYIQRRLEEIRVHTAYPLNNSERGRSQSPMIVTQSPVARRYVCNRHQLRATSRVAVGRYLPTETGVASRARDRKRLITVMASHANRIMVVQTHRLIGIPTLLICVIAAGIVLMNISRVRKSSVTVMKASARHSVTKIGISELELPWSWSTVVLRTEVRSAVQPSIQSTGRSTEKDGPPIPCHRCGGGRSHSFNDCPAASAVCFNCGRREHLNMVCRHAHSTQWHSKKPILSIGDQGQNSTFERNKVEMFVKGRSIQALLDMESMVVNCVSAVCS